MHRSAGSSWPQPNKMLGTHFTPLRSVAERFAGGVYAYKAPGDPQHTPGTPSAIVHAQLHMTNPKHFPSERGMDLDVARYAGKHYPGWHDQKLNDSLAWSYSDNEGTHRDWHAPVQGREAERLGDHAQQVLQWHPELPGIMAGYRQHLHDQGHHGITYGNEVEGPGDFGGVRHISVIATHPSQIETRHVEHIAPPDFGREGDPPPEPHQITHRASEALSEPGDMLARVVKFHKEHGGAVPQPGSVHGILDAQQKTAAAGWSPDAPLYHGALRKYKKGTVLTPEGRSSAGSVHSGDYVYATESPESAMYFGSMHDFSPQTDTKVHVHRVVPVGDIEPHNMPGEREEYSHGNYRAKALLVIGHGEDAGSTRPSREEIKRTVIAAGDDMDGAVPWHETREKYLAGHPHHLLDKLRDIKFPKTAAVGPDRFGPLHSFLKTIPVRHDPALRNEARADEINHVIRVGNDFHGRSPELQRHELTHEAAHLHKLDDWYLRNKDDWDLHKRIDYGHLNGQTTPGEIMAEAYATHWTDPAFLHEHAPTLIPEVREGARAVGLPLPAEHKGKTAAADGTMSVEELLNLHSDEALFHERNWTGNHQAGHSDATKVRTLYKAKADEMSQAPRHWAQLDGPIRSGTIDPVLLAHSSSGHLVVSEGGHRIIRAHQLGVSHLPVSHDPGSQAHRGDWDDSPEDEEEILGGKTATADGEPLENPYHGGSTWFHGTRSALGDLSAGYRMKDEDRATGGHGGPQFNKMLGTHFDPLHSVAHRFASASMPSAIHHAELRFKNPAHFESEGHLLHAATKWAAGNHPAFHEELPNGEANRAGTGEQMSEHLARAHKEIGPDDPRFSRLNSMTENFYQWHPKAHEIARGFADHLAEQGHHGITYGNSVEGPRHHVSAIATHPSQIRVTHAEQIHPHGDIIHDEKGQLAWDDDARDFKREHVDIPPGHVTYKQSAALNESPEFLTAVHNQHHPGSGARVDDQGGYFPYTNDRPQRHPGWHYQAGKADDMDGAVPWHETRAVDAELPAEIHRGLPVQFSPEDHAFIHDEANPPHERAARIMSRLDERDQDGRKYGDGGFGRHWSVSEKSARGFATRYDQADPYAFKPDEKCTRVVLHARTPAKSHMISSPRTLEKRDIMPFAHGEQEVPLRKSAPVHLNGISWGRPGKSGDPMTRYDFPEPMKRKASVNPPCYHCHEPLDDEDVDNDASAHEECEQMRSCPVHGEHDDPVLAEQHRDTHTDWGDHLPFEGGIHRGLVKQLPHDVHSVVHDESRSPAERAHALRGYLHREGFHGGTQEGETHGVDHEGHLGVHWTPNEEAAKSWGSDDMYEGPVGSGPKPSVTHVVLHAQSPHEHEIETDPDNLEARHMYGFDHERSEHEVPLKYGAPVRLTGISWKQGGTENWHRHDLGEPSQHLAGGSGDRYYHGTHLQLNSGDIIEPGHKANYDKSEPGHVYLTNNSAMAHLFARIAVRKHHFDEEKVSPRVYEVHPTGSLTRDEDAHASDGAAAYKTRHPLTVVREVPHEEIFKTASGSGDRYVTCDQGHTHWGAHGAAGLLVRHRGDDGRQRYLLQKRSDDVQHGGTWSTPGGALHAGESPEEGALREAREELGPLPRDLTHHHTVTDDHGEIEGEPGKTWAYSTVVMDSPSQFTPKGGGSTDFEHAGHGWFAPDEVKHLDLHPGFAKTWDTVRRSRTDKTAGLHVYGPYFHAGNDPHSRTDDHYVHVGTQEAAGDRRGGDRTMHEVWVHAKNPMNSPENPLDDTTANRIGMHDGVSRELGREAAPEDFDEYFEDAPAIAHDSGWKPEHDAVFYRNEAENYGHPSISVMVRPSAIRRSRTDKTAGRSRVDKTAVGSELERLRSWRGFNDRRTLPLTSLIARDKDMREVISSGRKSLLPDEAIVVKPRPDIPGYEIHDGHHRVAEAIRNGRTSIDADIDHSPIDKPMDPPFFDFDKNRVRTAALRVTHEAEGIPGNLNHITRTEEGTVPIGAVARMRGADGERPGEHRNKQGAEWEKFKADIAANGMRSPIFITVDHGEDPKISEGNHRRDAAMYLGMTHVPVHVRYYGHAEQQGSVTDRVRKTAAAEDYRESRTGDLPAGYAMEVHEEEENRWGHPTLHLKVNHEGKPVAGLGVFQRPDPETGSLVGNPNVWVHPEHQRKGLGTAMYAEVHRRWPDVPVLHSPHQSDDARALNRSLRQRFGPGLHHGSQPGKTAARTDHWLDPDPRDRMVRMHPRDLMQYMDPWLSADGRRPRKDLARSIQEKGYQPRLHGGMSGVRNDSTYSTPISLVHDDDGSFLEDGNHRVHVLNDTGYDKKVPVLVKERRTQKTAAAGDYRYEHLQPESKQVHWVNAYHPDGHRVGDMTWHAHGDHRVSWIAVYDEDDRRKGIAAGMWNKAREVDPHVSHNNTEDGQTDAGRSWAQTTTAGRQLDNPGKTAAVTARDKRVPIYHGARYPFQPGDLIHPGHPSNWPDQTWDQKNTHVYATDSLDEAAGFAEQAKTPHQGHVFEVEPTGRLLSDKEEVQGREPEDGPAPNSWMSRHPLRVLREVHHSQIPSHYDLSAIPKHAWDNDETLREPYGSWDSFHRSPGKTAAAQDGPFYHGTLAEHAPGDKIEHRLWAKYPGSRLGAELYASTDPSLAAHMADLRERQNHGVKPGRIYEVRPQGKMEPDEVANPMTHGNSSYMTRDPLHVVREVPRHEWLEDLNAWHKTAAATRGPFFHGTDKEFKPGDHIAPGHKSVWDSSDPDKSYFTSNLGHADMFAYSAAYRHNGTYGGHVYEVEPSGLYHEDRTVTEHGVPVQAYQTPHSLKVIRKVLPEERPGHGRTAVIQPGSLPAAQQSAFDVEDMRDHRRQMLDVAKNPDPGTRVWRGELRPSGEHPSEATSTGMHWSANYDSVITRVDQGHAEHGLRPVVWQGVVEDHEKQAFGRGHPMWYGRHESFGHEAEVRFKPGAKVKLEGAYVHDPKGTHPHNYLVPSIPERTSPNWKWYPLDHHVTIHHRPGNIGSSDYSDVGINAEGAVRNVPSRHGPDGKSGGMMVAIVPPGAVLDHLQEAMKPLDHKTEARSKMHVTLLYLGEEDDHTDAQLDKLPGLVAQWCKTVPPFEADLGGAGVFHGKPDSYPLVALVNMPGEARHLHHSLVTFLKGHGLGFPEKLGWIPHVTLAYSPSRIRFLPKLEKMSFPVKEAWYCRAGRWESFPLTGRSSSAHHL